VVQIVGRDAVSIKQDNSLVLGQEEDVKFLVAASVVEILDVGFQAWKSPGIIASFKLPTIKIRYVLSK